MTKQTNLEYRTCQLESNYKDMDEKIQMMLENHLPHIELAISELKTRVNVTTAINVGAIILGILVSRML